MKLLTSGTLAVAATLGTIVGVSGCTHRVQVDPIKIEPIYATLDVNLKVDRELDEFFAFEEEIEEEVLEEEPQGDAAASEGLPEGAAEGGES